MISRNILQKAILLIAVYLLAGCVLGAEPPAIGEIEAKPSTTITTGEKSSLIIPASGSELRFEWTAQRGTLSDSAQPAVIYTAPDSPGPDTVTVKVTYSGGEIIRSITFDVVEPPPTPTPTVTDTPVPEDTPTPTAVPNPIACDLPPVTGNLFPQLAEETGQFSMYGPVGDPDETNFLCEAVYDKVHEQPMAVHIKYENVGTNFGWWGVATPNGYDASGHSQVCFWAYALEPNQSFRMKMKDTTKREQGVVTTIETPNEWTRICTDISKFAELGILVDKMDNVNLGFERPTGSAEIWIAEFEFK